MDTTETKAIVIKSADPEWPQPEDYTICDYGRLGGKYYICSRVGKGLGEFDTFEECEAAIKADMEKHNFWPNVWRISDHGNAHLLENL